METELHGPPVPAVDSDSVRSGSSTHLEPPPSQLSLGFTDRPGGAAGLSAIDNTADDNTMNHAEGDVVVTDVTHATTAAATPAPPATPAQDSQSAVALTLAREARSEAVTEDAARSEAVTEDSAVQKELEDVVCVPIQSPLIRCRPRLRRARTPVSVDALRRSGRLAAKPRALNATKQAQIVLLRKLGVEIDPGAPDLEIEAKFKATFRAGNMSVRKQ